MPNSFYRSVLGSFFLVVASAAFGSQTTFSGTTSSVSGVTVYSQATVQTPGDPFTLKLSGAGVGKRTFGFLTVNAYVAASYVQDVKALRQAKTPLDGIRVQKVKVLKVTMLWNMSSEQVRSAFEESLLMNDVDTKSGAIQSVLAQFDTDMKRGDSAVLVGYPKSESLDTFLVELKDKTISESGKELSFDFWKIWFGKGDKNLPALQALLVGKD